MSIHYILEGHKAVPCDLKTWARNFEHSGKERTVVRTEVAPGIAVSTVFLGLDHSYGEGPPLLFESLVFGGPIDQWMERYTTWEEAEAGHAAIIEKVKAALAASFADDGDVC